MKKIGLTSILTTPTWFLSHRWWGHGPFWDFYTHLLMLFLLTLNIICSYETWKEWGKIENPMPLFLLLPLTSSTVFPQGFQSPAFSLWYQRDIVNPQSVWTHMVHCCHSVCSNTAMASPDHTFYNMHTFEFCYLLQPYSTITTKPGTDTRETLRKTWIVLVLPDPTGGFLHRPSAIGQLFWQNIFKVGTNTCQALHSTRLDVHRYSN